jgi:hypothetical protein
MRDSPFRGAVSIGIQEDAEQGGGGQQPPVESFGVFIVFWREAVPHLWR